MKIKSVVLELTLLTLLILAITLFIFLWLASRWQKEWHLEEVQRGLLLTSDTLHNGLRDGMMSNKRESIVSRIQRVAQNKRIQQIRIIEHRGRSTLSSDRKIRHTAIDKNSVSCKFCHSGNRESDVSQAILSKTRIITEDNIMRSITPVLAEPGCITDQCHSSERESGVLGIIDLSLSLEEVDQAILASSKHLLYLTLAILFLGGIIIWYVISRVLEKPLKSLLMGIRKVGTGDLNYRLSQSSQNEFGELSRSFNTMSAQLVKIHEGLVQTERLISMGKLAAGVAHEINNPLTGILSYAEDLLEEADSDDPNRGDYEVIIHEAIRCRKIVRNLLNFSKQQALNVSIIDPNSIMKKAIEVVIRQPSFKKITIKKDFQENIPKLMADPLQIQQVIMNLLINAQQAMPEEGVIKLKTRMLADKDFIELSVKDNGMGIPENILIKIFEPFYSTKGGENNGLGLAVCLGIVKQHGGTIKIDSVEGKGTTFGILLPVKSRLTRDNILEVSDNENTNPGN